MNGDDQARQKISETIKDNSATEGRGGGAVTTEVKDDIVRDQLDQRKVVMIVRTVIHRVRYVNMTDLLIQKKLMRMVLIQSECASLLSESITNFT